MTPDTSTTAVEAFEGSLSFNGTLSEEVAAELLLALAAERDELIANREKCIGCLTAPEQAEAVASARRAALEQAAQVADEAYMRAYRSQDDGDLEPGTIAAAIRALIETTNEEK